MQFKAVIALFAAAAMALPATMNNEPRSCEILQCAAALGPAGVACVAAAVQEGLNPLSDLPCIAALLNDYENIPEACKGCE
jgi:hypothetical protein